MDDLFYREQQIFDNAANRVKEILNGGICGGDEFNALTKEYGKLLKQLRRVTKISDRTADNLNTSKLDLLDKVHCDALTGIYNRRFMEERLKQIMKSLSRAQGILSVLMIDVDFFKRFNDTYGHSAGDSCLKAVAEALTKSIARADDFVARYGGEEFAAVLPHTDENGARLIANRFLENVRKCGIPHVKNDNIGFVTISVGITTGKVKNTQNITDFVKKADEALYISKESGRNRYTFINFKEESE